VQRKGHAGNVTYTADSPLNDTKQELNFYTEYLLRFWFEIHVNFIITDSVQITLENIDEFLRKIKR